MDTAIWAVSEARPLKGGHRVPAIAHWPGQITPNTRTGETVLSMDWFPTFAALAGFEADPPNPLDGIDITTLMLDEEALPERSVFWRYRDRKAVRRDRWKFVVDEDSRFLFDMETDLNETTDLSEQRPELTEQLATELTRWEDDVLKNLELRTV
ncbi:MAG: sulfatase [Candidatus Brocadiia bacterium]